MSSPEAYVRARRLIDDAHKQDPLYLAKHGGEKGSADAGGQEQNGKQDELEYADAVERWIQRLIATTEGADKRLDEVPGGTAILQLAARCQHLERFKTPRSSYPEGKPSYLKWRRDLYTVQANRAVELLEQAGVSEEERENVRMWVSKTDLKPGKESGRWGTQVGGSGRCAGGQG